MIAVRVYANADDVLIAWKPDQWPDAWVAFNSNDETRRRNRLRFSQTAYPRNRAKDQSRKPASPPRSRRFGAVFGPTIMLRPPIACRTA